jgi:D-glycero-D-manno-heptose 1,7-bisphosphate phosphatase
MSGSRTRAAVFLDRDGVINVDTGYPHKPEDLELTPTAARAIALINRSGALAVVITNQSGVARGMFTLLDVDVFHGAITERLAVEGGARLDAIYVAPYHPEGSVAEFAFEHDDRKPGSGMLRKAVAELSIDPARSVMIGDKPSDAQAATDAGIAAITVPTNTCDLAAVVSGWLAEQKMDCGLD